MRPCNGAANPLISTRVPPYTRGDAQVHYEKAGWRFAVNLTNFADEKYVGAAPTSRAAVTASAAA